jgi:hypothetical protein
VVEAARKTGLPAVEEIAMGIKKVVRKVSLREQKSDFAYWQTQSYQARLAALEEIREEFHRWKYGAEPGFQRVYSIGKR